MASLNIGGKCLEYCCTSQNIVDHVTLGIPRTDDEVDDSDSSNSLGSTSSSSAHSFRDTSATETASEEVFKHGACESDADIGPVIGGGDTVDATDTRVDATVDGTVDGIAVAAVSFPLESDDDDDPEVDGGAAI